MPKLLKIVLVIIVAILLCGVVLFVIFDETLPEGKEGAKAEKMADNMMLALNKNAWDSLSIVSWSYPPGHHYIWYKHKDSVIAEWDDFSVYLDSKNGNGRILSEVSMDTKDSLEVVNEAFEYFINDSFWLIAPFKVRDAGTVRKYVKYNGEDALLVTYTSGGVTPGDSYLWLFDEDHKPRAWKFWVQIVPIGGLEFSWEAWVEINGAFISTVHDGLLTFRISNLKGE